MTIKGFKRLQSAALDFTQAIPDLTCVGNGTKRDLLTLCERYSTFGLEPEEAARTHADLVLDVAWAYAHFVRIREDLEFKVEQTRAAAYLDIREEFDGPASTAKEKTPRLTEEHIKQRISLNKRYEDARKEFIAIQVLVEFLATLKYSLRDRSVHITKSMHEEQGSYGD